MEGRPGHADIEVIDPGNDEGPNVANENNERTSHLEQEVVADLAENFRFLHANVDGYITRAADMTAELRLLEPRPQVVMFNETKTDQADKMFLEGYTIICRKDRTKRWRRHCLLRAQRHSAKVHCVQG